MFFIYIYLYLINNKYNIYEHKKKKIIIIYLPLQNHIF